MKKLIISALCLASAGAYASKPYIAVGVGGASGSSNLKSSTTSSTRVFDENKTSFSNKGLVGDLKLGYGYLFKTKTYLALEGLFGLSNVKGKTSYKTITQNYSVNEKVTLKNSLGINAHIGQKFDKILPYAIVGFVSSKWNTKIDSTINATRGVARSLNKNKKVNGLVLGLGAQYDITAKHAVGVEFTHTRYKKIKNDLNDVESGAFPQKHNYNSSFKPTLNKLVLNYKYSF